MAMVRRFGKAALALGVGGLGVLEGIKIRDDRYADRLWQTLEQPASTGEPFKEEMVAGLPDPARRYFLHAIRPGTPLASKLHWRYTGEIRPAKGMPWLDLTAEQIVARERGFVWKARAGKGPLVTTGTDYYLDGESRIKIALFGLIPLVVGAGSDISRSAVGRLLIESFALPAALLPGPHVAIESVDEARFRVIVSLEGDRTPLTATVD